MDNNSKSRSDILLYFTTASGIIPARYLVQYVVSQYGSKECFTRADPSVVVLPLRVVCCRDDELLSSIERPANS